MTDKELHRLSRRDILQLMLAQGKETEELRQVKAELEQQLEELTQNYERLKKRLDYKDEQIHQLQDTLEKERTNRRIELEEAGSIAEASLRLNGLFETAQKAADQYLYNIRRLYLKSLKESSGIREEKQGSVPGETAEEYKEDAPVTVIRAQDEALEAVAEGQEQDRVVESLVEGQAQDRIVKYVAEGKEPDRIPETAEEERQDNEPEAMVKEEGQKNGPEAMGEWEEQDETPETIAEEAKQYEELEAVAEEAKQDEVPETASNEETTRKRRFSIFRRKKAV